MLHESDETVLIVGCTERFSGHFDSRF